MVKIKKVKKIILIFALQITFFINHIYAMSVSDLTGKETTRFDSLGNEILGILALIGSAASIIFLIILGIKYMLGSVEEKASYKSSMLPYFIGAILVFGASGIAGTIYAMVK